MNFFKRTKNCFLVICLIDIIIGICILLKLLDGTMKDIFLNPDNHILLLFIIGIFIVLNIILIILKCIISDANEDLTASFNLNNTTEDKD